MNARDPAKRSAAEPGRRLFGTDGIRGPANIEPMTCEMALRIGEAMGRLAARGADRRCTIVVGRDTRLSGDMLESALTAGVCAAGADAEIVGILPTPGIALLTRQESAAAGVVISASHNPFTDNGIKIFGPDGFKLPDSTEEEIERLVLEGARTWERPTGADVGRRAVIRDAAARYVDYVRRSVPAALSLQDLKVVVDCAHGASYAVGPAVFEALGACVIAIGVRPDGTNINQDAGALHPERLRERVMSEGAHLGVALDGDGDRLICVDEHGAVVDGDEVLAMVAADMLAHGTLRQSTVVATVMSNLGLEIALRARGVRLVRVRVGDRYVVEEMRRLGCNLGGEQSGHLLFLDHGTTGDGLLAGLAVARLVVECQRPLSELRRVMSRFPQVLRNVRVAERRPLDEIEPLQREIERLTAKLNDRGRVLVRYSGTEPLVRVMVEGENGDEVESYADELVASVRRHLRADAGKRK